MEGKPKSTEGEGEEDDEFGDFASPAGASVSDEEKTQNLVGMGFAKAAVTKALAASGGNVQGAMSILMGGASDKSDSSNAAPQTDVKPTKAPPSQEVPAEEVRVEQKEEQEGPSSTETSPSKTMLGSSSSLGMSGRGLLQKAALFGKSVESSLEAASNLVDVGIDYCQDKAKEKKVVEKVSSLKEKTFSSFGSVRIHSFLLVVPMHFRLHVHDGLHACAHGVVCQVFTKSSSMRSVVASAASKAADKASSAAGTLNAGKLMSSAVSHPSHRSCDARC